MRIERLEIRNYRVFRHAVLSDLPRMAVVVGANGSGKSTLFDVFSFLKDAVAQDVDAAVDKRGGLRELVSRDQSGPICFKLNLRDNGGRLITYELEIGIGGESAVVVREVLRCAEPIDGQPQFYLSFSHGQGMVGVAKSFVPDEVVLDDPELHVFSDPSVLAINVFGRFREHRTASELRNLIENWHISRLHVAGAGFGVQAGSAVAGSAIAGSAVAGYVEHVSIRGDNVAKVARYIYERHPKRFRQVLDAMRRRVPGIESVEAQPTEDGRLVLRFQDGSFKDPFIAPYVSDGTLKMFAYLVLLYDPKPHPLLAIEEPENQLYPELLHELAEEFRDYARRGGQVFVSTHSPDFLNGVEIDEVYYLVKQGGYSSVRRAHETKLLRDLVEEGDLPGSLWKQGLFEGASPR